MLTHKIACGNLLIDFKIYHYRRNFSMAQIISVVMNKGGVAKTTLVTNLAGALGIEKNAKVLIVDTDGQGNSTATFGFDPDDFEDTIYDAFTGKRTIEEVTVKVNDNIDLVPANEDMNFLDFDILTNLNEYPNYFTLLKEALRLVDDKYDYIVIDSPPSMGLVTSNVIVSSDDILLPYIPEPYGAMGLLRVIKAIMKFKDELNPKLNIQGVVGMMVDKRTIVHANFLEQARLYCKQAGVKVMRTTIPKSTVFPKAVAYEHKPAVYNTSKGKKHAAASYYDLMEEILNGKTEPRLHETINA
ncbi:chromosome partitioning protein ParA [Priestia megaterium]|nr:chromosome partitioning protein ParA [Priestia megaterium]